MLIEKPIKSIEMDYYTENVSLMVGVEYNLSTVSYFHFVVWKVDLHILPDVHLGEL